MTCALQVQKREDLEEKPYDHDTRDLPLSSSLLSELQPLLDEAMGLPSLMKKGAKSLSDIRVVVAMSGGVDSSVAAVWLARAGYDVIGVTLQLYDHGEALAKKGTCCAGQDIKDARRVAEQAGFPHYVMDYESLFRKEVIESFADDYLAGQTPIPCVRCNQTVKFRDLYKLAHDMGVDALVTGHYVRRVMGPHGARLHRALDATRDQSYFLFATTQDQLDFLRFPLGGLPKARVRELARELGVQVAEKPDSQDICFVPQGRYTDVIRRLRPGTEKPGEIVHEDGRVLGQHKGIISYTIGQRRGLGIAEGDPLFVTKLDVKQHRVIVGPRSSLLVKSLSLKEVNWLGKGAFGPQLEGQSVWVKTRSTRHPVSACFRKGGQGLVLDFEHPEEGVAPGQACVFYDSPDDHARLLGGGWIIRQDATS